jgi:uncharacterized protein
MKLLISDIPSEGIEVDLNEIIESEKIVSPIKAHLRIEKIDSEIVIKGEMMADVKLQCSRCLKDFHNMLTVPVDVVYHPIEELKGAEKYEIKGGELDMDFYSGEEMDLLALLNEQVLLNLPMKPLCDDSCKGICLTCGTDLNAGMCNCIEKDIDPRLKGLKELKDKV